MFSFFNRALAWQNEQYEQDNRFKLIYSKLTALLTQWRKELSWLKECHSQVLQQSLKKLERAFKNFFQQRADFSKFKKKGLKERFRFPQGCKIESKNDRLYLPKIGWVLYRNSREMVGEVKNVTASMKCGRFLFSIQTEFKLEIPTHQGGTIGIDMDVAHFTTLSNGEFFEPLNEFKTYKSKLAKLQK
ncbi:RNA-guided endonuclease InsQ/TnpB family protein [Gallibacterium genomosp. 2]|uniref:RNA-guided endonuclease InsQ/TnpB family protein n=1 Tax=Gallibacterium genomosp. 2 TaxID=155517 RepID=UPI000ADDE51D|nr:RNA-guided endonuclease TnpB family protein [Gallibacterium genomosp. 2]